MISFTTAAVNHLTLVKYSNRLQSWEQGLSKVAANPRKGSRDNEEEENSGPTNFLWVLGHNSGEAI